MNVLRLSWRHSGLRELRVEILKSGRGQGRQSLWASKGSIVLLAQVAFVQLATGWAPEIVRAWQWQVGAGWKELAWVANGANLLPECVSWNWGILV